MTLATLSTALSEWVVRYDATSAATGLPMDSHLHSTGFEHA